MSRPLTDAEREQLREAVRLMNVALENFTKAGFREVHISGLDMTDFSAPARRYRIVISATRDIDLERF
jgi:site-specific DNA-cytosine methylase